MQIQRRTLRFWRSRATRNKWVYQEETSRGDVPVIGVLYLSKALLEEWGDPDSIDVVVTPAGAATAGGVYSSA